MVTNTTNFQFLLPGIANPLDENLWGGYLNTNYINLDSLLRNIVNQNIGTVAPTNPSPQAGTMWLNNSNGAGGTWPLNIYDGTSWVPLGYLDTTNHSFSTTTIAMRVQTFTVNGTYTPTTGMAYCIVEAIGGGGGAGACVSPTIYATACGGGGAGAYSRGLFSRAQIGASQTVTIGAGGAAANPFALGSVGISGGSTTLGTLLSVGGGGGAKCISSISPGDNSVFAGGIGGVVTTGGFLSIPGGPGGCGFAGGGSGLSIHAIGGNGGASAIGTETRGYVSNGAGDQGGGSVGASPGGGGSGASSLFPTGAATGGAGANGMIIITEFI